MLRGVSVLVAVLLALGAAVVLLDAAFELPAWLRGMLLAGWIAAGVWVAVCDIVRPRSRHIDLDAVAALIEEEYPDLAERLTTAVELSGKKDDLHGSPVLIGLLLTETAHRSATLDFRRAAPGRSARRLSWLTAGLCLVAAAPFLVRPASSIELAGRFLFPWRTAFAAPYALEVTPGDVFTATGRPLALTATIHPKKDGVALPESSTLVITDESGQATRLRMLADRADTFSLKLDRVAGSFTYRIEAGDAVGESFHVTAVEPVELAADSPDIKVTPPEYARKSLETETLHVGVDFSALQYSHAVFDLRFTRPAVAAYVEWTPEPLRKGMLKETQRLPVELIGDATAGRVELPVRGAGTYRLVMEAEHGIRTELEPRSVAARPDQPPAFTKVTGSDELKTVLPYDRIPLEIGVADDIGVSAAAVEYRIGAGPIVTEPIELQGAGTREAAGRHLLQFDGRVKEGDEIHYRLRVADNRRVPDADLEPQTVYHPADRWRMLKIARQATPLAQQEIAAQRDEIDKRLEAIKADLLKEQRGVYKLKQESAQQSTLAADQKKDLKELRQENQRIDTALRDLARDFAETPALQPITERVESVADQEMRRSADALKKADKDSTADERAPQLTASDSELTKALERLEDLRRLNERVAQERLDQMKLQFAADRQQRLADRANELTAKDPVKDSTTKPDAEGLKKDQGELAQDVAKLTEQSEALRQALDAARAQQAQELAQRAKELAEDQRRLADASKETNREQMTGQLAELANKQRALADKANKLAEETKEATEAARTKPLRPDAAKQATESLTKGDAGEAMNHQERATREFDRVANELDKAIRLGRDPREAAKQLARLEEGLQKRAGEAKDAAALKPLEREQRAIARAIDALSVPPQNKDAQKDQQDAAQRAAQAAEALKKSDAAQAKQSLEQSRQALDRLANRLPSLEDRQRQARGEIARLRQQQDEIARQSEQAVKKIEKEFPLNTPMRDELAKRLADNAKRQAEIADRLATMDAPNQEARQQRTADAVSQALSDLLDARPQDVTASQQQARRELERLEQALSGKKPIDEQAGELARRQQDLARVTAKAASDPKSTPAQQQEVLRRQQQITREAQNLSAPEAPQRLAEAVEAAQRAEQAANAKLTGPDAKQRMETAARAFEQLARQTSGAEANAERARRVAQRQSDAAADAERKAKNEPTKAGDAEMQRRQQQVAEEARQLRGGEEGQLEKQYALEALAQAQKPGSPADQAKAQRNAANALQALADRLNKPVADTKPGETSPQQTAQQLAQKQRELAQAAEQAEAKAGKQPNERAKSDLRKTSAELANQQRQLNQQAARMPAQQAPKATEQARSAMNQARDALARGDTTQAQQKQREAAAALDQLAQQKREPSAQRQPGAQDAQEPPEGLPSRQQAEQAQQLAKEQRELRDAVQKVMQQAAATARANQPNPAAELARQQEDIARHAGDLSRQVAREQGDQSSSAKQAEQAADQSRQASKNMQAGAVKPAAQAGQKTADQLRQLAKQLAQTPRGPSDPQAADPVKQASQLAERQEGLNRRMAALAQDPAAQRAQQLAHQQELQKDTGELMQDLNKLAQQMARMPKAQQPAQHAAQSTHKAKQSMQQAQDQMAQCNQGPAGQSQQDAAQALDQAAQQASQAAAQAAAQAGNDPQQQHTGQSVQQAQQRMDQAQNQLTKGQSQSAQSAMQQAAQALQQAARQMNQQAKPGDEAVDSRRGAPPQGAPDPSLLPPDMKKYAGKRWGELPGELQTRIIQDMKARYGDDYARVIKLYFEQIADTKQK
jgi:hypothetical protein